MKISFSKSNSFHLRSKFKFVKKFNGFAFLNFLWSILFYFIILFLEHFTGSRVRIAEFLLKTLKDNFIHKNFDAPLNLSKNGTNSMWHPRVANPSMIYLYRLSRWKLFKLLLANIMFSVLSLNLRRSIWHCFCFLLPFQSYVCVELWNLLDCSSCQHYRPALMPNKFMFEFVPFMEISRRKVVLNPFLMLFVSIYIPNCGSISSPFMFQVSTIISEIRFSTN